ncbi:MAG: DUF4286 family protein [Candidatus Competibacteraceae bacterium]|nr:DUF4286 family protein [Candidatus Competibacteraceae bacterium]
MIVYNVTIQVDADIHQDWLLWMQQKHIPDVMATGCFVESRISRMITDDESGITYSIQYTAPTMQSLHQYEDIYAADLQQEHHQRYEGKYVVFRTMMEVISFHK